VQQTIESGAAPSRGDLDLEFPGARMRALPRSTPVADLFR
jgi:hypothetical protein